MGEYSSRFSSFQVTNPAVVTSQIHIPSVVPHVCSASNADSLARRYLERGARFPGACLDLVILLIPYVHHAVATKAIIKSKVNAMTRNCDLFTARELYHHASEAGIDRLERGWCRLGIDHLLTEDYRHVKAFRYTYYVQAVLFESFMTACHLVVFVLNSCFVLELLQLPLSPIP